MRISAAFYLQLFILFILLCTALPANSLPAVQSADSSARLTSGSVGILGMGDSLSLHDCIEIAMRNNPRIRYRESGVSEADAERDLAAGRRWPDIKGTGSYLRYSETLRMAPPREPGYPLIFADEVLSWNIHASIPVFTGWRISNELESLEFLRESAINSMEFASGRVEYQVTRLYFSILKQRMVVESLEFSRRALKEHLEKVKKLISAEKASRSDMLRVEVRLADVIQNIEAEKGILAVHKRSLLNLMGMDSGEVALSRPGNFYPAYKAPDLEEALSSAYSSRADYLAAQKELQAQEKRVQAARSEYWPTISLFASYTGQRAVGSFIELPGSADMEDVGTVGCLLELPIYTGGKRGAKLDLQKARLAGIENSLRTLKLQIRLEVESSLLQLESTRKRLDATDKAVDKAIESLRIEREKYELGKGTVTDVLDAESALRQIRAVRYSAVADYNIQIAKIKFKTGEYHEYH